MKTYKQLLEDIELVSGHPRTTKSDMRSAQHDFDVDAEFRKPLGKIHKDYSLHRLGRKLHITHDPSGKVVGHIDTHDTERGSPNKTLYIAQLNIDREHTKKKIGHSLAVAAYKHLHKTGHTIHSGTQQSVGGVLVWLELMNDPSTSRYVYAIHSPIGGKDRSLGQASKLHTGDIWTSGSREARTAGRRKGIQMHKYLSPESERAEDVQLVLMGKKNGKKKKEMNEDVIRTGESPQEYRGRLLRQISNGNISSMDNHDRVHGALAYIDSIKQHYEGRDRNINLVVAGTGTDGGAKIGFVVQGIHPKGNHIIAQPAAKGAARHPRLEEIPIKNIYGLQMSTYPNMKIEHRETLRRLMDFRGLREMMENFKQLIFEKRKTEGKPYKGFKKGKNHPEGGLSRSEAKRQGIHAGIETKDEAKRKGGFGKLSKKTQSRRKSFCARMCGMKKRRTSSKTARDPKSKINAALRVWGCRCGTNESYEPDINMIMESKNNPTDKKLWSRAKALARKKFDVYPSAYANAWASKWYKKRGGGWSKSSTNESYLPEEIVNRENAGTMTDQEREEVARLAPKLKNVKVVKKGDSLKNARHRYAVYLVLQKRRKQKGKKQEKGRKKKKG